MIKKSRGFRAIALFLAAVIMLTPEISVYAQSAEDAVAVTGEVTEATTETVTEEDIAETEQAELQQPDQETEASQDDSCHESVNSEELCDEMTDVSVREEVDDGPSENDGFPEDISDTETDKDAAEKDAAEKKAKESNELLDAQSKEAESTALADSITKSKLVSGVWIYLTFPVNSIPDDAVLSVEEITDDEKLKAVNTAIYPSSDTGTDIDYALIITCEEDPDVYYEVEENLDAALYSGTIEHVFDIRLLSNGAEIQPELSDGETVRISFVVDQEEQSSSEEAIVYEISEDEDEKLQASILEARTEDGSEAENIVPVDIQPEGKTVITVETECLSVYALNLTDESLLSENSDSSITVLYRQSDARKMLSRVNAFRQSSEAWYWNSSDTEKIYCSDLGALNWDYNLELIAMVRAAELVKKYSHERPGGTYAWDLMKEEDYDYSYAGENIAYGWNAFDTENSVFIAWREDNCKYIGQGHRRNMLNKNFTSFAASHVKVNNYNYWVQLFARSDSWSADDSMAVFDGSAVVKIYTSGAGAVDIKPTNGRELKVTNTEKTRKFVNNLYTHACGITPGEDNLDAIVSALINGTSTASSVAASVIFGADSNIKNYCNEHFVAALSEAVLQSSISSYDQSRYVSQLETGTKREELLNEFIGLDAFQSICHKAGIMPGSGTAVPAQGTIPVINCPYGECGKEPGVRTFVRTLYRVCLDREPDEGGLSYWCDIVASGTINGVQTAGNFIFSNEFKQKNFCNEHFTEYLYKSMMNRSADSEGKNYWISKLESGTKREEAFNLFAFSDEFESICNCYGITMGAPYTVPDYGTIPTGSCQADGCGKEDGVTTFVKRLYHVCMDREADAEGLSFWCNRMWNRDMGGKGTAAFFIGSDEFKSHNYNNEDYLKHLYLAFMGREYDESGLTYWLGQMQGGMTRSQVFEFFAGSSEFNGICNKYGIRAD